MKIANAIFKKPKGMENLEHVSIRTLIEDKTVFNLVEVVPRQRKVWVDGKDTGEVETVADVSIRVGKDIYHIFVNTKNLMTKILAMSDYAEEVSEDLSKYTCQFVAVPTKRGEMYDIVDA